MGQFRHFITCLLVTILASNVSCTVPNYIHVCARNNDLSKCLEQNFKDVVKYLTDHDEPAFKVFNLSSIHVPKIELQATPELQVSLVNVIFSGMQNTEIQAFNLTETHIHIIYRTPRLDSVGEYNMKGRILFLPLEGRGAMKITQTNLVFNYKAKLKVEERKGKKYYYVENNVEDITASFDRMEKVVYQFDNLFDGDPVLGPEANQFLNDNWEDIFNEIRGPLAYVGAFSLVSPYVNGYLRHIPIDQLLLSN